MAIHHYFSSLNGMVIYTSAMLAMSTYFDRVIKDHYTEQHKRIENLEFGFGSEEEVIMELKEQWGKLLLRRTKRLTPQLIALFLILVLYPVFHIGLLLSPPAETWAPLAITTGFVILLSVSVWLLFTIKTMITEKDRLVQDVDNFLEKYDLLKRAFVTHGGDLRED